MNYIHQVNTGFFSISLICSTINDLGVLLDPDVPLVHLCDYSPNGNADWWDTEIPLRAGDIGRKARLRRLTFDLELPTAEFIGNLSLFRGGLHLLQMRKSLAPNIPPRQIKLLPEEELLRTLIEAGMQARYTLPHPGEVGVFGCTSRERLERILEDESFRARCVGRDLSFARK